ncbi:hypothetical protein RI367_004564 [Sorochytrium milnesiophthora]
MSTRRRQAQGLRDSGVDSSTEQVSPLRGVQTDKQRSWKSIDANATTATSGDADSSNVASVWSRRAVLVLLLYTAVYIPIAALVHHWLPAPGAAADLSRFSEERARVHVHKLANEIGAREVGSDREDLTIAYIVSEIEKIQADHRDFLAAYGGRAAGATGNPHILTPELSVTHGFGQHVFDFMHRPVIKTYYNVTNIAVKVSCSKDVDPDCDRHAVVVNTHFDTHLWAAGAGDAATPVAIMIDVLKLLAADPNLKPRNSIILLWNGAEETLQDASHAFMMGHPWFKNVRTVVNMEACGQGGKSVLFQAKSELALRAYSHASYPHGTVAGNDIFKTGFMISDTDYKQFLIHAKLLGGLDIAYYQNSYVYHTQIDLEESIPIGAVQHMGQNTLDIVRWIAAEADLSAMELPGAQEQKVDMAYFDILGRWFVFYPISLTIPLQYLLVVSTLYIVYRGTFRDLHRARGNAGSLLGQTLLEMVKSTGRAMTSALLTFLVPILFTANIMTFVLKKEQTWFRHEALPFVLYVPSAVAGYVLGDCLTWSRKRGRTVATEVMARRGALCQFAVILFVMTQLRLGMAYMFSILLLSLLLGQIVTDVALDRAAVASFRRAADLDNTKSKVRSVSIWEKLAPNGMYAAHITVLAVVCFPALISMAMLFVPLVGRIGQEVPCEHLLAFVAALSAYNIVSGLGPVLHRFNRRQLWTIVRVLGVVTILLCLVFAQIKPYTALTPKRYFMIHNYDAATKTSQLYLCTIDRGQDYQPLVDAIDDVTGRRPTFIKPFIHDDVDNNLPSQLDRNDRLSLPVLYPFNTILNARYWSTSHVNGKFWFSDSGNLEPADKYAEAYQPMLNNHTLRIETAADNSFRLITIPCGLSQNNMWTVWHFKADIIQSSLAEIKSDPTQQPTHREWFIRHSSGGSGQVDWESLVPERVDVDDVVGLKLVDVLQQQHMQDLRARNAHSPSPSSTTTSLASLTATQQCDFTMKVRGVSPITFTVVGASKHLGERNYLLRRVVERVKDAKEIDLFRMDTIMTSVTV